MTTDSYDYTLQTIDLALRRITVLREITNDAAPRMESARTFAPYLEELYELLLSALVATDRRYVKEAAGVVQDKWEETTAASFGHTRADPKVIGATIIAMFKEQRAPLNVILEAIPMLCQHWRESCTGIFEDDSKGYAVAISWRDQYRALLKAAHRSLEAATPCNFLSPGVPARHGTAAAEVITSLDALHRMLEQLRATGVSKAGQGLPATIDALVTQLSAAKQDADELRFQCVDMQNANLELQLALLAAQSPQADSPVLVSATDAEAVQKEIKKTWLAEEGSQQVHEAWVAFENQVKLCEFKDALAHSLLNNVTYHRLRDTVRMMSAVPQAVAVGREHA